MNHNTKEKQAEFLSLCIESYKMMMGGLSGMKIANFFEEFGIFDFLLEHYDEFHQLDNQQLLNEIKRILEQRGA
jgi:hypothetical protein